MIISTVKRPLMCTSDAQSRGRAIAALGPEGGILKKIA